MKSFCATTILVAAATSHAFAAPRMTSDVRGVAFTLLTDLPRAPKKAPIDPYCETYSIKPNSLAGRLAAAHGWIVTSEARLGPFRAVSFAGSFEPGTSGVCFAHDGNIAIFAEAKLVALAYGTKSAARPLGTVEPIEPEGLIIRGGDGPSPPIGELHMSPAGFSLTPLAMSQPVCSGRSAVPNIYDLDIRAARKVLLAKGWRPEPPKEAPGDGDQAAAFAKEGLVEAVSCSGTGFGFCAFTYRTDVGGLSVSTAGEGYKVYRYETWCRRPR